MAEREPPPFSWMYVGGWFFVKIKDQPGHVRMNKSTVHTHVHMLLGIFSRKERETYVCVFYDKYHTDLPL